MPASRLTGLAELTRMISRYPAAEATMRGDQAPRECRLGSAPRCAKGRRAGGTGRWEKGGGGESGEHWAISGGRGGGWRPIEITRQRAARVDHD